MNAPAEIAVLRQPLDAAKCSFELSERVFHMEPEDKGILLRFLQYGGMDILRSSSALKMAATA